MHILQKYFNLMLGCALLSQVACQEMDEATKKQIKKEGKKLAKQVGGALNNIQATEKFISYEAMNGVTEIKLYWKDDAGNILGSLQNVHAYAASKGDSLLYACNGGMYMENQEPLGAFKYDGKKVRGFNLGNGAGNFYLKPKGVFYVHRKSVPTVQAIETQEDRDGILISKASCLTQSGPMLVIDSQVNKLFMAGSSNLNIRNGVGILPNGNAYFAMSALPINFYDFAKHFQEKGCKQALYLDGFVSRSYAPSRDFVQTDGAFGVVIGVVQKGSK
jgi:uncharacterized protein YigE (DUF2233 family)